MARLTPFEVGQIKAHLHHELGPTAIAKLVQKADGEFLSKQAVVDVTARLEREPSWRGDRAEGSGRQRSTTKAEDNRIRRAVFNNRGKVKVTVAYLKQIIPSLRSLSDQLVRDRLHEAGLQYLRRRRKSLIPTQYLEPRKAFAQRVCNMQQKTLDRWAYSDGTVFYLDRTAADREGTGRAALGSHVWRQADRSDALYSDCVGPSTYAKAQGIPVKLWGLLAKGQLHVTVLPADATMNRWIYADIVKKRFPDWLAGCDFIVQDFEKCLRCEEPLEEMRKQGLTVVPDYPKCSQDLNAIENAWKLLRERLSETLPTELESREQFIPRLRNAVRWLNANKKDTLLELCTNQKRRCSEVLRLDGARTRF